jgi:hypothetical protein
MSFHRKREPADVVETELEVERFSDIVISKNRWRHADDRRHRILVSTESTFGFPIPSGARSSKRCVATTRSEAAGRRFRSGSETSWWPTRASSSKSRSPARLYVTSAEAPRTGNDCASRRPSVGQLEGDANEPKNRNRVDTNPNPFTVHGSGATSVCCEHDKVGGCGP